MAENVEVELRALIESNDSLQGLMAEKSKQGVASKFQNRFLIDYSTFLEGVEHRTRDIRVRVTNGERELIAKVGAFGATSRLESAVTVTSSTRELLTTMAYAGFLKGVAAIRNIERFTLDGIEYAVQEVRPFDDPDSIYSRFIEAEVVTDEPNKQSAVDTVRAALNSYGLTEISEADWYAYIKHLNEHANGVFDFDGQPNWQVIEGLGASRAD